MGWPAQLQVRAGRQEKGAFTRRAFVSAAAAVWLIILSFSLYHNHVSVEKSINTIAINEARSSFNKDLVYRRWAAMHGGVYVPPTEATPPNPYLAHHPARDIVTTGGKSLTLINPAYMTRQVYELGRDQYGLQGHITSLKPLRPQNAPDPWEKEALQAFEKGEAERSSIEYIDGEPFLRFMGSLRTEEGCLHCHAVQGYAVGDVRGGISVGVPMKRYWTEAHAHKINFLVWHSIIGIAGIVGLWAGNRALKRSEKEITRRGDLLEATIEALPIPVFFKDTKGSYIGINAAYEEFIQIDRRGIIGKKSSDVFLADEAELHNRKDLDVLGSSRNIAYESILRTKGGDVRYTVVQKAAIRDRIGNPTGIVGAILDVTDKRLIEQERRLSEERLKQIIEFMPDCCFVIDGEGRVAAWNRAMEDLSGLKGADIIGKGDYEYSLPFYGERRPLLADLAFKWDDSYAATYSSVNKRDDGVVMCESFHPHLKGGVYLWEAARVFRDLQGRTAFAIETIRDISSQKMLEQRLKAATESAMEASLAKDRFIANVSHEIRTPLNGILGMTVLLLSTELDEEQKRYVEALKKSGETLLNVVNDILDFSKLKAGKTELDIIDFDLTTLLDDLGAAMALKANEKRIELITSMDPDIPATLRGDPGRIRQVLTNLTANAIKFTEQGEVVVSVSRGEGKDPHVHEKQTRDILLQFSVSDTGIGIPKGKLEMIFDEFTQVDASTTRRFGGTGLGLAICREFVSLMGGEIIVQSEEGKGSSFRFTLRLETPAKDSKPSIASSSEMLEGVRVLILDDNPSARGALKRHLTAWGARTIEAENAQECLEILHRGLEEKDPVSLVIIDMQMPGASGEEVGRIIKADESLSDVRMVILTPFGMRGDACRFREAGFSGYATKPIKSRELKAILSLVISASEDELRSFGAVTRYTAMELLPRVSGRDGAVLVADDNIINREVMAGILGKMGLRADAVSNGLEALSALEVKRYDMVFMDVQMPVMDGIEATRLIRQKEAAAEREHASSDKAAGVGSLRPGRRIPIIAMTAHAFDSYRDNCLASGMDDYVSKPVTPDAVADVIERIWTREEGEDYRPRTGGISAGESAGAGSSPSNVFDFGDMMARLMNDRAFAVKVAASFLSDMPRKISVLKDAVKNGSRDEISRQAHAIRGAAENIGGKELAAAALEIEQRSCEVQQGDLAEEMERIVMAFDKLKEALLKEFSLE